jgi:thiol-disulfide isomerase/thioredoxin
MNTLKFLSDRDFKIQQGKKGNNLCVNIDGLCIVLFSSQNCPHCKDFFPQYKTLSSNFPMITFGVINIQNFKNVVFASQNTSSPITHVPYILLYFNKKPIIIYTGDFTFQAIGEFLQSKILTKVNNKTSFVPHNSVNLEDIELQNSAGMIPYNIVCDQDSCYLSYGDIMSRKECNKADGCQECTVRRTL